MLHKGFESCLDAAGLRRVRFHDLRHTFVSLIIQQQANPKYIQEQIGHGGISISLDVYSHLFHGEYRHYLERLHDPPTSPCSSQSAIQPQPTLKDSELLPIGTV